MTDLDAITQRANQLIAFADGYEEATTLLGAALVETTGLPHGNLTGASQRMRVVARDTLELVDRVRAYERARNGAAIR